jgi:hypothetical protein
VTRASGQGCLKLPRPILSLLADDCKPYRHLTSAASSPFRALADIAAATPSTHHHPFVARMPTCAPAALSHRISCGAPWRPITVVRCSAAARHCSSRDASARSSMTKSHTACPAGRDNAAESTPSRPLCNAAHHARVARVRWRPSLCRVDTWMPPYPAHYPNTDVQTNAARVPFMWPPFAATPLRRASKLALPPGRALTSFPLSLRRPALPPRNAWL